MIVTTGRIIKVASGDYHMERNSETPGIVTVVHRRASSGQETIALPANPESMEQFIAAYRRAVGEDVGYRKTDVE